MRDNVRTFVKIAAEALPIAGPIYEFGAYQVEGQHGLGELRGFFPGKTYLGCDMRPGPGVDRIEDLAQLTLPSESAGAVLCLDTLEHVFEIRRAVEEMTRVLAPGGTLMIAAPMNFPIHEYPDDYWRLTPSCLMRLLEGLAGRVIGFQGADHFPHTVFALGFKGPIHPRTASAVSRMLPAFQTWLDSRVSQLSWTKRWKRSLNLFLRGKGQRRLEQEQFRAQFVIDLPVAAPYTIASSTPHPVAERSPGGSRHCDRPNWLANE